MSSALYHATAVQIGGRGILISGKSGFGKTATALGLMAHAKLERLDAQLIADDQVELVQTGLSLMARTPKPIAGKIEIRGFGISQMPYIETAEIHLATELVDDEKIERMPEIRTEEIEGVSLPFLLLPKQHEAQAIRIVFAWLDANR